MAELDNDLQSCLENNPQEGYTADDIAEVLAVWEGANDGGDWRWILKLNDGRFVFLQGGCDYTGWDCRSFASSEFFNQPQALAMTESVAEVQQSLLKQLIEGKAKTWHETKGEEFGSPPFVEPK